MIGSGPAGPPGGQMADAGRAITVFVNGEPRVVRAAASALDVVTELGFASRPVAVEVNERVVPRRDLAACMLIEGDRLEIVTLVGGG
jgi:sulfur carrier protein